MFQRKSMLDDRMGNGGVDGAEGEAESSGPEDDDKEVNLDNFMTLDSVGDVDGRILRSRFNECVFNCFDFLQPKKTMKLGIRKRRKNPMARRLLTGRKKPRINRW